MTENKRFANVMVNDKYNLIYVEDNKTGKRYNFSEKGLEKFMNNLSDENENLKFMLEECMEHKLFSRRQLEKENEQLKSKLFSKEDLIQQLKNELNSDCYKESRKYQNEFIRVCEELAEINQDYKKILEENKELKQRNNR